MDKTVSQKMQDELEPIMHDESDDIEKIKKLHDIEQAKENQQVVMEEIQKKMSERGWVFHMDKGPGVEF
jgi:hypothetical protein